MFRSQARRASVPERVVGSEVRAVGRSDRKISVVICVYTEERWDDIVAAVESVRTQTRPAVETILVVDHNDLLFSMAQTSLPDVVLTVNHEKQGLSGARNSGIAIARGDVIAFLDDDAVAAPNWLELLDDVLDDPRVLGVGGHVEPNWVGPRPNWFPEEFLWTVGCSYRGLPMTTAFVRNPFGGCTCIRREVFDTVGGFRSEIGRVGTKPLGCEETELAIRARNRWPDRVFVYEPQASIRHKVPENRGRWSYFVSRCYSEGLSKARVARLVGARDGLSSERTYTMQTLPTGVLTGLGDALLRGDRGGLGRAAAIVAGLAYTTAGYIRESVAVRIAERRAARIAPAGTQSRATGRAPAAAPAVPSSADHAVSAGSSVRQPVSVVVNGQAG